jgi:hypothetical protein
LVIIPKNNLLLPLHVNHEDQSFLVQEIINGYDYERLLLLPRLNEQKPIREKSNKKSNDKWTRKQREKHTKKERNHENKKWQRRKEQTCI